MQTITIVSLGTGDERLLTREAETALRNASRLVLRTRQHPMVPFLTREGIAFETLDALYDECADFDTFNLAASVRLMSLSEDEPLCYAVSDASMDNTVLTLLSVLPRDASAAVVPGVSHAQRCLALVGAHPPAMRILAASEFLTLRNTPCEAGLILELNSRECAGEVKLRLSSLLPDEWEVTFLYDAARTGEMSAVRIPLYELDRQPAYDHMSAVYVPPAPMESRARYDMDDLVNVMTRLRAPDGCPWDREQTHESLLVNLLEESYEFIQAVRDGDVEHMYDELGDVLLQVAFHAEIARQHGDFDLTDVTTAICRKMIERHPHIFGAVRADTSEEVLDNWEAIKRRQRGITSTAQAMADVSAGLSALMRAQKVQHKAHKVGFDFPDAPAALEKVREETQEVAQEFDLRRDPEAELGDLLFSVVNVCRLCDKSPDIALFEATNRFISRFQSMENKIKNAGKRLEDLTLSEMDVYWSAGKQGEGRV